MVEWHEETRTEPVREVMTTDQLAAYAAVCTDTIRTWANRDFDPLPALRINGRGTSKMRFRRDLFDEWMKRQMTGTIRPNAKAKRR